ncbi:hypothetical protein O6H91_02G053800 [Diphasiastrum complanatum]|uniref:Uncharacterized protein n=2 Tax=Diphasiastrum complanatum TaxID=34168 RepID=A0ACC2EFF9_DIPCM|nr:hypothetical protein O6H91_02G053800 [Diphasiastrum complanatum]KAJ7565254.1 hypothetical protein O6H91_02G053800 [Diphasiastrum complanatum]
MELLDMVARPKSYDQLLHANAKSSKFQQQLFRTNLLLHQHRYAHGKACSRRNARRKQGFYISNLSSNLCYYRSEPCEQCGLGCHTTNPAITNSLWQIQSCRRRLRSNGCEKLHTFSGFSSSKARYASLCSHGGLRRDFSPTIADAPSGNIRTLSGKSEIVAKIEDQETVITASPNKLRRANAKSGTKSSLKVEDTSKEAEILVESQIAETTSEKWLRAKKLMGDSLRHFDSKTPSFSESNASLKVQSVLKSLAKKIATQQSGQEHQSTGSKDSELSPGTGKLDEAESGVSSTVRTAHSVEKHKGDSSQKLFSAGSVWQHILRPIGGKHSVSEKPSGRVVEILGSLTKVRSSQEVEVLMKGLEGKVTMPELKQTLAELGKEKHWLTAMQVFDWMHEHVPYKPDETVYQLMFLLLAKAKKMEMAEGLLERMKKEGMQPGVIEYTALIAGYVKHGNLQQGLLVLDNMRELGIKPAISAYNVLIDGCVRFPKGLEVAGKLLEKMNKDQIEADALTYSNVIILYSRKWRYREVLSTFSEIQNKGYHLDKAAGNAVLNSYSKLSDVKGMLEAYQWISDWKVEQDLSTYHIIFNSLARSGRIGGLPLYYSLMRKASLIPDIAICSILITAYGKVQDWDALDSLLQDMKDLAVRADATVYNTLISVYGKAGRWEDLELIAQFLRDKQRNGLSLDVVTYNNLLNVYGKEGRLNDVMKWFSDMKIKGVKPDVKTFTALVTAYSKANHYEGVEDVLELLKKDGYKPDLMFYQSILVMLGRGGRYDDAWKIIEDMREGGYLINADVYNSLIAIYGRGNAHEARKLFGDMIKHDVRPTPATFKTMIDIHGQKGLLEECVKIFEESMAHVGKEFSILTAILNAYCNLRGIEKGECLLQDRKAMTAIQLLSSYNFLIRGYGRTGEWTKAEEVLKRMKSDRVEPNLQTYIYLLEVYARVGQIMKGEELIAYMQKENLLGSIRVYNGFLQFYVQHKNGKAAMAIYDLLRKKGPKPDHNTYTVMVDAYLEDGFLHENFVEFLQDVERARLLTRNGFFRAVLAAIPKCRKHEDTIVLLSALEVLGFPGEILALLEFSNIQIIEENNLLWERLAGLLRLMDREGLNVDVQRGFHNALIDALWSYGWEAKALRIINISVEMGIYGNICGWDSEEWFLDLHHASVGAAQLLLFTWIASLQEVMHEGLSFPDQIKIILSKDWQMRTGENLPTRQAVEAQLKDFMAPFAYAEDNCILEADRQGVMEWLSEENISKILFLTP